jgi:hypothetical protein
MHVTVVTPSIFIFTFFLRVKSYYLSQTNARNACQKSRRGGKFVTYRDTRGRLREMAEENPENIILVVGSHFYYIGLLYKFPFLYPKA